MASDEPVVQQVILDTLPHRPPFLFVDEIVEIEPGKILARRTMRVDEDFFKGHYPHRPITPGVLVLESIFQAGALLMGRTLPPEEIPGEPMPVLTRIKDAKFRRPVNPGETVDLEVEFVDRLKNLYRFKGRALVDGTEAVRVTFSCALIEE